MQLHGQEVNVGAVYGHHGREDGIFAQVIEEVRAAVVEIGTLFNTCYAIIGGDVILHANETFSGRVNKIVAARATREMLEEFDLFDVGKAQVAEDRPAERTWRKVAIIRYIQSLTIFCTSGLGSQAVFGECQDKRLFHPLC